MKFPNRTLAAAVATALSVASAPGTFAQDTSLTEEVVVIGTRTEGRSALDSPAPVDVIGGETMSNQGDTDMSNLLRNVVPSYNVNDQPISDAATLVRPANLRGLAPDHTLMLVNGKRRHRASVITWLGNGISNGSQGPDAAAIPALALKRIEVLRDGASAQYGSDAIAGVMNFVLNDASEGGSLEVRYGEYKEGDGEQVTIAGNIGLPLGDSGFLNLTAEWGESDPTSRSEQRADAQSLIDDGYQGVPVPAMIWGRPIVNDDMKLWANFGVDLSDTLELYGHANYNSKEVDGGFFFRNPTNRGAVYSGDGGATLLIGDLTPNDGVDCPVVALNGNIPDPVAFAQVKADPNCFSFQETITGGFTPRFGGDITDMSFLIGLRGEINENLRWDVSASRGEHEADFFINNTVNASLGPDTPRDFDPGLYKQTDTNFNADLSWTVSDNLNIGFGGEFRNEEFEIGPGQVESYTAGPLADQGFSTSSNGFPGFPAVTSGTFERENYAVYVDAEWTPTDSLVTQGAIRFEDFDGFGSTTNFKVGANWAITDNFGVRSTYSTGFKAPTPGQSNASNTSTELTNVNGVPTLINNGTIPATNPVALAFGGRELDPEESTNFTAGFYATLGNFEITVDYYDIDVEDRINLSSEVKLTQEQIDQLVADNVPGAGDLTQFRFFTNDFDTNTHGIDVVVSTYTEWLGGTTDWNLAYNNNKTEVEKFNPDTIGTGRIRQIEETTPETRWNLSANHTVGNFRVLARLSFYDEWYDSFENDVFGTNAVFDSEYLIDLELEYRIGDHSSILIGGNNITDESGQKATDVNNLGFNTATILGNTYSQYSPFGISGAFWYARYRYSF
jgi:iron complex outermembrane receptor protein